MILDDNFARYRVSYPFQITCFRSLYEHYWEKEYAFCGESHNFWEFACMLEGEAEAVLDEKIYLMKPGNFLCCPPMCFHRIRSVQSPCRLINFSFEHTGTLPDSFPDGIFYLSSAESHELKSVIRRLQNAYLHEPADPVEGAEASCALVSFLLRLSKHPASQVRLVNSRSSRMYQKLVETMRVSIGENLTIQQIASRNAISVTTVKELFKQYAGISPKAYYTEMRSNEALRLLKAGKEIIEVAELLNYSSPNYFSYSFKKQFGIPPGQYCRQLLEADESYQKTGTDAEKMEVG